MKRLIVELLIVASSYSYSFKATFKQYIDHDNHSLGTFDQRYYYDNTSWNGTGKIRAYELSSSQADSKHQALPSSSPRLEKVRFSARRRISQ